MSDTPPLNVTELIASHSVGMVDFDAPCRKCGYNLRGLERSGRCPECATPAAVSILGDRLCYSDPQWLDTMARGLRIILWGYLASLLANLTGAALGHSELLGAVVIQILLQIAAAAFSYWGAYLVTAPDPSGVGESKPWNTRRFVRVALLVGLLGTVVGAPARLAGGSGPLWKALVIVVFLASLISSVGEFFKFALLGKLAERIPAPNLTRQCRIVRWGYTVFAGVMILAALTVAILAIGGLPAAPMIVVGCLGLLALVGLLVFLILAIRLQYKLAKAFAEQAFFARSNWSQYEGPTPPQS